MAIEEVELHGASTITRPAPAKAGRSVPSDFSEEHQADDLAYEDEKR